MNCSEQFDLRARSLGIVETPPDLVAFMTSLAVPPKPHCRVLEPACGSAPFLTAFSERYGDHHELVGIEVDPKAVRNAHHRLPSATIIEGDFLLWHPNVLFDIIIGNPPYGIIGDASHYPIHVFKERKELYRQRFVTWKGKFNIYGAFIEHAVNLLAPDGKLVFVVPASWMVLDEFARLRKFLAASGRLEVYYIGKAFLRRNVSCVVLLLEKGKHGLTLYDGTQPVVHKPSYSGTLVRFETPETVSMERAGVPLGEIFDIRFAARSPEFRAHPLVSQTRRTGDVPVLTGRNLKPGWIDYETCYSGLWMPKEAAPSLRFFYGFPHIVIGHTKGARVVAAYDERCYPWREEMHLVPKEAWINETQLVTYLNSELVQKYVRTLYRDIVPHLTITQLKLLPVPPTLTSVRRSVQLSIWDGSEG
ncbi:MAG: hypothetical protein IMHGJWDQ_000431 [Candidatus Fervidibacter sp.]